MILKHLMELFDILDDPTASAKKVGLYLHEIHSEAHLETYKVTGDKGETDFIKVYIYGKNGKHRGGTAPTIGLVGRLGGLGARPAITGFVSDGDGALVVLAAAAELLQMQTKGDLLEGDVYVVTHICPNAPTRPHKPVPMMDSPIPCKLNTEHEINDQLDAILSVDSTRANKILNHKGFAITPTVKDGVIMHASDDLLNIMQVTTGELPYVMALAMPDITPYENGLYHINSILQPSTMTTAPVVGVALTTTSTVAGCATGASQVLDNEMAGRFIIEVAKYFGLGECKFYDEEEFKRFNEIYGSMKHLQNSP